MRKSSFLPEVIYLGLGLLMLLGPTSWVGYLKPLQVILAAIVLFYLGGEPIVAAISYLSGRRWDAATKISLSILYSLFFPPWLLMVSYSWLGRMDPWLVYLAYAWPLGLSWLGLRGISRQADMSLIKLKAGIKQWLGQPLVWAVIIIGAVHLLTVTRYSFLPAPDSYSWLIKYEAVIPHNQLPPIEGVPYRQAYAAFIAATYWLTGLPLFTLMKYFLPGLVLLTIPPLWLVARRLPTRTGQLLILLWPLLSPALILEFDITRQQALVFLYLFFAVGLLTEAARQPSKLWWWLTVLPLVPAYNFHPAFRFLILLWIIALAAAGWPWFWRHKRWGLIALALMTALFWLPPIDKAWPLVFAQARAGLENFWQGQWNWHFPAHYINSDKYEMGWPGIKGVVKYYAFYAGGPVLFLFGLATARWVYSPEYRERLKIIVQEKKLLFLTVSAIFFITVAEIAPRIFNISYLPERAWQLAQIVSLPLLIVGLERGKMKSFAAGGLLVLVSISVAGALYLSLLTLYTMPAHELKAASWIKQQLPAGSIMAASSSKNVIRYHGGVKYVVVPDEVYTQTDGQDIVDTIMRKINVPKQVGKELSSIVGQTDEIRNNAEQAHERSIDLNSRSQISPDDFDWLKFMAQDLQWQTSQLQETVQKAEATYRASNNYGYGESGVYLYYAATDLRNPYNDRPYETTFTGQRHWTEFPGLTQKPQWFEEVYRDGDLVRIWRLKVDKIPRVSDGDGN